MDSFLSSEIGIDVNKLNQHIENVSKEINQN